MIESQQSLIALIDTVQAVPRSASGDPRASERAEFKMRESGAMRSQALEVLELVRLFPGRTSKELARAIEVNRIETRLDRPAIGRRLPELESAKLVRRTDEDRESKWWAE